MDSNNNSNNNLGNELTTIPEEKKLGNNDNAFPSNASMNIPVISLENKNTDSIRTTSSVRVFQKVKRKFLDHIKLDIINPWNEKDIKELLLNRTNLRRSGYVLEILSKVLSGGSTISSIYTAFSQNYIFAIVSASLNSTSHVVQEISTWCFKEESTVTGQLNETLRSIGIDDMNIPSLGELEREEDKNN